MSVIDERAAANCREAVQSASGRTSLSFPPSARASPTTQNISYHEKHRDAKVDPEEH